MSLLKRLCGHPSEGRSQIVLDTLANYEIDVTREQVELDGFPGRRFENILVQVGDNPGAGTILFVAHTDRTSEGQGAIDNGSGVVQAMDLFDYVYHNPQGLKTAFLFADGEEHYCIGSRIHVGRFSAWYEAVYCLDCVGAGDTVIIPSASEDRIGKGVFRKTSPKLNEKLVWAAEQAGLYSKTVAVTPMSDHVPFLMEGMDATLIHTTSLRDAQQWSSNPGVGYQNVPSFGLINSKKDTFDSVDPQTMAGVGRMMRTLVDSYRT